MKTITSKQLVAGMKINATYYNCSIERSDDYEFLGFTDDKVAYGEGAKVSFKSSKELLKHYNVKTMKELEKLQDENEYGYSSRMVVKDLKTGEIGPWFYLFEGRWCRGSGADKLSFKLIEEKKEEPKKEKSKPEVNKTELRREMENGFNEVIIELSKKYFNDLDPEDIKEYLGSIPYTNARYIADMLIAKSKDNK